MWIYLGFASALLLGLYDVCKKHAVRGNAVLPTLWLSTISGLATVLIVAGVASPSLGWARFGMSPAHHSLVVVKALLVAGSWVLAYFAMKHLPISLVAPIRASSPFVTLVGAVLLFGERPTPLQWLGIAVVLAGHYAFALLGRGEGVHFHRDRWVLFLVLATILGALSGLYDKALLQRVGFKPAVLQLWFSVYLVVLIGLATGLLWFPRRAALTPFTWRPSIPMIGILLVAADYLYFTALHDPAALVTVLSIVRRTSAVVSFCLGGLLFRDLNKRRKLVALVAVLIGVALILLG